MRHQALCSELKGIVAKCYSCHRPYTTVELLNKSLVSLNEESTRHNTDWSSIDFPIPSHTIDVHAMRHPYVIQHYIPNSAPSIILNAITNHRFNEHDQNHKKSCFKKRKECRFKILTLTNYEQFKLDWNKDDELHFYNLNGSKYTTYNFSVIPRRHKCDMFMETYSRAVSHIFGCNTNIQLGSYNHMFYSTLYSSKGNQEEENWSFAHIYNAVAKRLKRLQMSYVLESPTAYGKRLGTVLSGIAAHVSSFIISATLAWRIAVVGSRLQFSSNFSPVIMPSTQYTQALA
jgi:hypothetical protein